MAFPNLALTGGAGMSGPATNGSITVFGAPPDQSNALLNYAFRANFGGTNLSQGNGTDYVPDRGVSTGEYVGPMPQSSSMGSIFVVGLIGLVIYALAKRNG